MDDQAQNKISVDGVSEVPVVGEEIGFKPDELKTCGACGRANSPARSGCLYCAHPLEITGEALMTAAPNFQRPDSTEHAFNVVCEPSPAPDFAAAAVARLLGMDAARVTDVLHAGMPLPAARYAMESEANAVVAALGGLGVTAGIIPDTRLLLDGPPRRARSLEFSDGVLSIYDFNTGQPAHLEPSDLVLIVAGRITESRVETEGRRKLGDSRITENIETDADRSVIDLYRRDDPAGMRISTHGFDFSCLGPQKGLLAAQNITALQARLSEFAPGARVVDKYSSVRTLLSEIWETEISRESGGVKREYFKLGFEKVTKESNAAQFTKFSRLQFYML